MSKNDPIARLSEGEVRDTVVALNMVCKERGYVLERDPNLEVGRYGSVAKPTYKIRRGKYVAMQVALDKEEGKSKRAPAYAVLQGFLVRATAELVDVEYEAPMGTLPDPLREEFGIDIRAGKYWMPASQVETMQANLAAARQARAADRERWANPAVFSAASYNTYAFGDQIRALGGRWDKEKKQWEVPGEKAEEAKAIAKPFAYVRISGNEVPRQLNDFVRGLGGRWQDGGWYVTRGKVDQVRTAAAEAQAEVQAAKQVEIDAGYVDISKGEGYGGQEFSVGQVIRHADGWYTVVHASKRYFREDGMSFGVGDESGYIFSHKLRPATPEEAAAPEARRLAAIELKAKKDRVQASLRSEFLVHADRHFWGEDGQSMRLEGETVNIGEGQTIYGGGEWFVVQPEWIWYVQNNGADGDNWSGNNIRTGGAGARGYRFEHTPERDEIVDLAREIYMKK
jgi:hypothetical protein